MKKYSMAAVIFLSAFLSAAGAQAQVATGDAAPDFTLQDTSGQSRTLSANQGSYVVLEWINHDCPFVKKHYDSGNMQKIQAEETAKGVIWYSIASSAEGKQGYHTAEEWQGLSARKQSAATAVLLDPQGSVGKLYGAQTTPHMYVINPEGKLIYQGAIDSVASANPEDIARSENYVQKALREAESGNSVSNGSTKAYGCSVKY